MPTRDIKKLVLESFEDEKRSGRLSKSVEVALGSRGAKPTTEVVEGAVRFIREYIEYVPFVLEQGRRDAEMSGVGSKMGKLLQCLEKRWFAAMRIVPDQPGLLGLISASYATLLLLQRLSDSCRTMHGRPLLQRDVTSANQAMSGLIGMLVVSIPEQRIDDPLADERIQRTAEDISNAGFSFPRGPDHIWGDASTDEIVNARLGAIRNQGGTPGLTKAEPHKPVVIKWPYRFEAADVVKMEDPNPPKIDYPGTGSGDDLPEGDDLGLGPDLTRAAPPPAPSPSPESRWLNAEIHGHKRDEPLQIGESYFLEFGVDVRISGDASEPIPAAPLLFRPGEESIQLTIQLQGTHFDIPQNVQILTLPRTGPSRGKARFDITPLQEGRGTLRALVYREGNFVMLMDLGYSIGTVDARPPSSAAQGRNLDSASKLLPRDISMMIRPAPAGGYDCTVMAVGAMRASLPVTEVELGDAIKTARDALMSVVSQRDGESRLVFQTGVNVDAASANTALRTLARAGASLFQRIFFGPMAGSDAHQVGDRLRNRAMDRSGRVKLQIVAERFPIPWGLLYVGEADDNAKLSWDNFLGMRFVIEQIPLTNNPVDDFVIKSDNPSLTVSVNVNSSIDVMTNSDVVARQVKFWNEGAETLGSRIKVTQRKDRTDLLDALRKGPEDQLIYLYCHAATSSPGGSGGIQGSNLVMTNDERLTLGDLNREAPMTKPLRGNPLVFINACESAELTPSFYDGFVPYFMAKSARGVIGTECKTPALFATEWALRFFPRFLGGESLGELFLDLRREFCTSHNNPLGLLYAVYCDGDTQIQPALKI